MSLNSKPVQLSSFQKALLARDQNLLKPKASVSSNTSQQVAKVGQKRKHEKEASDSDNEDEDNDEEDTPDDDVEMEKSEDDEDEDPTLDGFIVFGKAAKEDKKEVYKSTKAEIEPSNIVEGKRQRKVAVRYQHPDEEKLLLEDLRRRQSRFQKRIETKTKELQEAKKKADISALNNVGGPGGIVTKEKDLTKDSDDDDNVDDDADIEGEDLDDDEGEGEGEDDGTEGEGEGDPDYKNDDDEEEESENESDAEVDAEAEVEDDADDADDADD